MEILILILKIIFGLFFCYAGIIHFIKPKFFNGFIPDFLPKLIINYIFGAIEFVLGVGLFFNGTIKNASLGIIFLLIIFLPIHIWDYTKTKPAIGSKKSAIIRVFIQFILIYGAYLIYSNT